MSEEREQPRQERLVFESDRGWFQFGRIPYRIHYDLDCPDNGLVEKKVPGFFKLTPDLDRPAGNYSLSFFIHESVPKEFIDIVAFHELREAELRYADEMSDFKEAHKQAERETM